MSFGIHNSLSIAMCKDAQDAIDRGFVYTKVPGEYTPIEIKNVVVVQKGTVEGNSTVDFVMEDMNGNKYVFMITGRLLKSIPA